ncbi:MAG: hypothetical protein RSA99_03055 [Oscillospiraceae bacterium]
MTITKKMIDIKIKNIFEFYEQQMIKETNYQSRFSDYCVIVGEVTAMSIFGIIEDDRYKELLDRAEEIFHKADIND